MERQKACRLFEGRGDVTLKKRTITRFKRGRTVTSIARLDRRWTGTTTVYRWQSFSRGYNNIIIINIVCHS